jgi:hypothetical protein
MAPGVRLAFAGTTIVFTGGIKHYNRRSWIT